MRHATSLSTQTSFLDEQTSLPKITVRARGREPQFQAYVNAYIVGHRSSLMNGNWARPLYYLSLVAMKGQGTMLQGIFARLVSNHSKDVTIEGLDDVVLAHHHSALASSGYTLHWNFEQAEVSPTHHLHAVIESNMLTMCDPLRGIANVRYQKSSAKRTKERVSLSTVKTGRVQQDLSELRNRERNPLFLLMVPGQQAVDPTFVHRLHFAFLDQRVPWPLDPSWASFLWERGLQQHEIDPLTVWCYQPSFDASMHTDGSEENVLAPPFLADAYLCRPKPALLQQELQEALASRRLSSLFPPSVVALPPHIRESREEPLIALPS